MKLQVGVKILIINDKNQYLFLRRSQPVESAKDNVWEIPGGRIKPSEELLSALSREVEAETGLILTGAPMLVGAQDIMLDSRNIHVVRLTYRGRAVGSVSLSEEHDDFAWMSKSELLSSVEPIDPYIRAVLVD